MSTTVAPTFRWCREPFEPRRGGRVMRFCSPEHRIALHRAARQWAIRQVEAGTMTAADLGVQDGPRSNVHVATCAMSGPPKGRERVPGDPRIPDAAAPIPDTVLADAAIIAIALAVDLGVPSTVLTQAVDKATGGQGAAGRIVKAALHHLMATKASATLASPVAPAAPVADDRPVPS